MAKKEKIDHVPVFRSELQLKDDDIIPQIGMQESTLLSDANVTFIGGNRGGGKAQPYDADVLTPFGFKKMGLLKVGDQVMNPDGRGQYILQVHEQGVKDVYEIEFIDGAKCECTFDHLWQVRKTCGRQKVHSTSFFDNDPFFDGKVWTTEMIWDFMQKKRFCV